MFRALFSHTSESITKAAIVLASASLLSRVLGLVRDRLLTHTFGAGDVLDVYYAAFRIPDFLYNLLILGALSAAFIPIFTKYLVESSRDRAWKFMNESIILLWVTFCVLAAAVAAGAPWIMRAITPGFEGEKFELTVMLTRIMMLSPLFMGLSALVGGALQSLKKFLLYAMAPIMYNVGIILGIIFFVPKFGVVGLAIGVVAGAALHLIIQIPALFSSGFAFKFLWNPRGKDMRELLSLMGPRTLALATTQINFVIITILASKLSEGSVAVFNLANNIQSVPIGIVAVSYAVAAFPLMSEYAADENPDGVSRVTGHTLRLVLTLMMPIAVITLILRAQWVRILLGSGNFDWAATIATADTLGFFALGIVGQSLMHILARAFYALKDTATPAWVGIATDVIGIMLALALMRPLGVSGLALSYSINMSINALILWILLQQRLGRLQGQETLRTIYKLVIAALVMGLIMQGLKSPLALVGTTERLWGLILQAGGATLAGLIAFAGIALTLRIEEVYEIIEAIKSRVTRAVRPPADVTDVDSAR